MEEAEDALDLTTDDANVSTVRYLSPYCPICHTTSARLTQVSTHCSLRQYCDDDRHVPVIMTLFAMLEMVSVAQRSAAAAACASRRHVTCSAQAVQQLAQANSGLGRPYHAEGPSAIVSEPRSHSQ